MKVKLKLNFTLQQKNHFNNLTLNCIISFYYCFISRSEHNFIAADKVIESSATVCDLLSDYCFHFRLCLRRSSLHRVVDQAAKRRTKCGWDRCQLGSLDLPWVIPATCNALCLFQEGLHVFCILGNETDCYQACQVSGLRAWTHCQDSDNKMRERLIIKENQRSGCFICWRTLVYF